MTTENSEEIILLYNSKICRLCGQENENGYPLYNSNDYEEDLSVKINAYLPLRISDDGKFPRWVCPGCHLQVESTVQFFTLILSGQETLRVLYKNEKQRQFGFDNQTQSEATEYEFLERNEIDEFFPPSDNELIQNYFPEKRRPGRPRKSIKKISELIDDVKTPIEAKITEEDEESRDNDNNTGRRKRRIKVPLRYQEVVQGQELEKVYEDMGLIDKIYFNSSIDVCTTNKYEPSTIQEDVIGHLQDDEGVNLGDLIVSNRTRRNKREKKHLIKRKIRFMCDICKVCFWQEQKFLQHRFSHKNVLFECTQCLESFKDRNSLVEHQRCESHLGEGIIEGFENLLAENFDDTSETKIKLEAADNLEVTQVDNPSTQKISSCENFQNEAAHNINQFDQVFEEIDEMEKAAKVLHELQKNENFKINAAAATTADDEDIKKDINFVHTTLPELNKGLEENGKESVSENKQISDVQEHKSKYTCRQCEKEFTQLAAYMEHKRKGHPTGRRFVCSKCVKCFKSKQLLQRHQLVHSELRPFNCEICGATFKTKSSLANHEIGHHEEKKFICKVCNQRFVHKHSLKLHLRLHTGSKPFTCPECNKGFTQFGNMQEHMRIHTGERPYSCPICSKKFKTSSQCRMHVKRHEINRPLKCSRCEKSFVNMEELRVHERRHDNVKPYNCTTCDKCFIDVPSLKKHIRLHTGEKPFGCLECGRHFADRSNLNKHQKLHNNKRQLEEQLLSHEEGEEEEEVHSDEGGLPTPAISVSVLDDELLNMVDTTNATPLCEDSTMWNITEDSVANPSELDLNTPLMKPESDVGTAAAAAKQVVYVTYQDPNNPIGNKTTFYVVQ